MNQHYIIEPLASNKTQLILPLIQELNPTIDNRTLEIRLEEMTTQGYKCLGVFHKSKLIGVAGYWIQTRFYSGKFIEPDNVYILPEYRSQRIGEQLINELITIGKRKGCIVSELNCYLENKKGDLFWKRLGYTPLGYHYQKSL